MARTKKTTFSSNEEVSAAQIAARAYEIWLAKGQTHGHHDDDWRQAEDELTVRFDVVLSSAGENKISLIKELRDLTGIELSEAKEMVERIPTILKSGVSKDEAERMKERLTAIGAVVELTAVHANAVVRPK